MIFLLPFLRFDMVVDDFGEVSSFCPHCGFMLGAFIPGMECPSCGKTLI